MRNEFSGTPPISRRRLWIWVDPSVVSQSNGLVRVLNNGDAWEEQVNRRTYTRGDICGWSMTLEEHDAVLAALGPLITAGTCKIWRDEIGNLDDNDLELSGQRHSRIQIEADEGLTERTRG